MSDLTEQSDLEEQQHDARMGRAISRGIIIGIPVAIIALAIGIWFLTDNDLGDSFATSLLPGTLLGAFAGGFGGMTSTMD